MPELIRLQMLNGTFSANDGTKSMFNKTKYQFMLKAPFDLSNKCCGIMKKSPAHKFQKMTGRKPITAQMASESKLRTQKWLENGCNAFDLKAPISNPMSFWLENDVLLFVRTHWDELIQFRKENYEKVLQQGGGTVGEGPDETKSPLCSVYGEIVTDDEESGQMTLADFVEETGIFDFERPDLHCTGCKRTGCVPCMFGAHMEKPKDSRIKDILNFSNPKIADWMLRGGHFDTDGLWKPYQGLGYWFVIEWVNKFGKMNIWYPNREEYIAKYSTPETDAYLSGEKYWKYI